MFRNRIMKNSQKSLISFLLSSPVYFNGNYYANQMGLELVIYLRSLMIHYLVIIDALFQRNVYVIPKVLMGNLWKPFHYSLFYSCNVGSKMVGVTKVWIINNKKKLFQLDKMLFRWFFKCILMAKFQPKKKQTKAFALFSDIILKKYILWWMN